MNPSSSEEIVTPSATTADILFTATQLLNTEDIAEIKGMQEIEEIPELEHIYRVLYSLVYPLN